MKKIMFVCLWLLLFNGVSANPGGGVQAKPETFRENKGAPVSAAVSLRLPLAMSKRGMATARSVRITNTLTLPELDTSEIASLQQTAGEKALRVGVGRALPASISQPIDLATWQWTAVSGGKVAQFTLNSAGALRVRAQVQLGKFPAGAELRFYSPTDTTHVFGPYTEANSLFWSPTLEGESLGLELFLPDGGEAAQVELAIPQLSHLVVDPANNTLKSSIFKEEYASCQQDMACASPAWQETGKSVARYVFTDTDGLSYLCSGTVLADSDPYTQIPYFFTAAHCINNQQAASSMDMFWLYANATCGGTDSSFVQTTGGAQLLMAKPALDTVLVRLNNNPPTGVTLSGWTTTPLVANQSVTGIHHALGQPKKYALGNFDSYVRLDASDGGYMVTPDANGDFSQVVWHTGITAPGSSGSGVWVEQGGVHYLNGALLGGASECSSMGSPDEYSRFERTWPFVSTWLDAQGTPPTLHLQGGTKSISALVDGVIIARYLQGIRGDALLEGVTTQALDTTVLENQLAAVQVVMDVDEDGKTDTSKDAALLIRYLLGLRNTSLVQGMDLSTSKRNTSSAIATYLESILNATP
ncbi:trypsin-like peptidase domain-containing protein [Thiothrix lacustris]|uniref:Trypsin-like peptidase domain-containing protein n=1 Tax=Thiothrix lacustris TaxID=525917 RepID=A0ABY9MUG4_9GAMM|nr:trypsin-like peptidase domain-containing protein [Thiothrix lacustris]WML92314.1 trypsin-like peptidase domain-containing protein [Thiothrix lacustris]